MKAPAQGYPLTWPKDWPRNKSRGTSQFKTTLHKALENVQGELQRFAKDSDIAVKDVMISSNFALGNQNPADSGVAVYFSWDGAPTCIAVDRYNKIEENLQAIYRCIEAERVKLRHGGLNLVRAAFRGYAALPPPLAAGSGKPWHETLGVKANAEWGAIVAAHRKLAKENHPDLQGGSANRMAAINEAFDLAKKERGL